MFDKLVPARFYIFGEEGDQSFGKALLEGFFTQGKYAVAVVASLTFKNGNLAGWRAYIGASAAHTEDEVLWDVRRHGNTLSYEYAKAFFGLDFPQDKYDNGY